MYHVLLSIVITAVVAALWLKVLWALVPHRTDKHLPAGLGTFFVAGFLALPIHSLVSGAASYIGLADGSTWLGVFVYNVFAVGIVEEFSKWAVFAIVMHRTRPLRSPEDGVVMAAATALAFSTWENIGYALEFGPSVLVVRSLWATGGHLMYAALWGFVWSAVTAGRAGEARLDEMPIVVAAVLPVGVVHGLFNSLLRFEPAWSLLIDTATLATAIAGFRYLLAYSPYRTIPFRDSAEAIVELTDAIRTNPESALLRRARGLHLLRRGKFDAAGADFARASRSGAGNRASLACLAAAARWAAAPDDEHAAQVHEHYSRLSKGERRDVMRRLNAALRPHRDRGRQIASVLAGRRRNGESVAERRRKAAVLRAARTAKAQGMARGAGSQTALEWERRRAGLTEGKRAALAREFARAAQKLA